ncbi:hypothetical protein Poly30_17980 [Planctomycetes bacterium Poly30]|uniref:Uncharacterized protein n=1 Tax=Saltatorellus ferox TaxID=2528018 RepID=A0A518EQC7_9BACT|nr:hypothetical protein Poly30_17980 [Planctomycetes bacterium Poly30]
MKGVLFVVYSTRAKAEEARRQLVVQPPYSRLQDTRVHDRDLDPLLGVDLDGTSAQLAREEDVLRRFAVIFGASVLAGLIIDLSGWLGDIGLVATMGLGSLGIALGTLAVLFSRHQPLDHALRQVDDEIERGRVLLTIPTDEACQEIADRTARESGGQQIFSA